MLIGVICEGPTDYPAIELFLGGALAAKGVTATFKPLFPEMDRTRPEGGWANVLLWLAKNPPATRAQRYFAGGFFGGAAAVPTLDAIVIQLDSDILEDESFQEFVRANYDLNLEFDLDPDSRASAITLVLTAAAQIGHLTQIDQARHILLPAVDSTEAWCVAAFHPTPVDAQSLRGSNLVTEFMRVLEASESRVPHDTYAEADKSLVRRIRFCEKHAGNPDRVSRDSTSFALAVSKLQALS